MHVNISKLYFCNSSYGFQQLDLKIVQLLEFLFNWVLVLKFMINVRNHIFSIWVYVVLLLDPYILGWISLGSL